MAHFHYVEDEDKQVVDYLVFCSDFERQEFLEQEDNEKKYGSYNGWNGCHELEFNEHCSYCDKIIEGFMKSFGTD